MSLLTKLRWVAPALLVTVGMLQAPPALAVLLEASTLPACFVTGSSPAACAPGTETFAAPFPGISNGFARVAPGSQGASGEATLSTDNVFILGSGNTFSRGGGGSTYTNYDDFFVTGPATSDGLVATSFNLVLDGSFMARASAVGSVAIGAEASSGARLDVIVIGHTLVPFGDLMDDGNDGFIPCEVPSGCLVDGTDLGSAFGEIGAGYGAGSLAANPGARRGLYAEAMFAGASITEVTANDGVGGQVDEMFTTPEFMLPIGQPIELIFQFQSIAGVAITSQGAGQADAISFIDFSKSLEFPSAGPIFNLPDGFTVNSLGAQIADNRWTGGAVQPPIVVAVPEPASLPLLAFGMLALVALLGMRANRRS